MANLNLPRGIDEPRAGAYRARMMWNGARVTIGVYDSLADAEAALAIAKGDRARGTFVPPQTIRAAHMAAKQVAKAEAEAAQYTVADLAEDWLAFLARAGRTKSTVYTYESRYRVHIAPTFATTPIRDVTPSTVEAWYDALLEEHGSGVARPVYMTLSSMFSYACGAAKGQRADNPRLERSPCRIPEASAHQPVRKTARVVLSPLEVAEIAAKMPEAEQLAVLLAAWCGLRIGEVLALRRSDITTTTTKQTKTTWISVTRQLQARGGGLYETEPKSQAGIRQVPVPKSLVPVLNEHLLHHTARGARGLLFHRAHAEDFLHPNVLRTHFNSARDMVVAEHAEKGEPAPVGVVFHHLRHTALTHAGQSGATLEELKRLGGHADARVVQRYQHAEQQRLAALASDMDGDVVVPAKATVTPLRKRS